MKGILLTAATVASLFAAPTIHADPPPPWSDSHYPDQAHGMCAGGHGGAFGFGYCDGEHYPDGTYWHQVIGTGVDGLKPKCVLDNNPAPAGGCGGNA
jgi:hypothetical protein